MKVVCLDAEEWHIAHKNGVSQEVCKDTVLHALKECRRVLKTLSPYINVVIRPHASGLAPDTSVGGETHDSELIFVSFDESVPSGVEEFKTFLTSTIFHEANHAARFSWIAEKDIYETTLLPTAIWEGLATTFERDYGGSKPPWGMYGRDAAMKKWLEDLRLADTKDLPRDDWFLKRSDGRNWLAYRVGTWVVDRAVKNSGKSIAELTEVPAEEIILLAQVD